jgi:hypothetical protein
LGSPVSTCTNVAAALEEERGMGCEALPLDSCSTRERCFTGNYRGVEEVLAAPARTAAREDVLEAKPLWRVRFFYGRKQIISPQRFPSSLDAAVAYDELLLQELLKKCRFDCSHAVLSHGEGRLQGEERRRGRSLGVEAAPQVVALFNKLKRHANFPPRTLSDVVSRL